MRTARFLQGGLRSKRRSEPDDRIKARGPALSRSPAHKPAGRARVERSKRRHQREQGAAHARKKEAQGAQCTRRPRAQRKGTDSNPPKERGKRAAVTQVRRVYARHTASAKRGALGASADPRTQRSRSRARPTQKAARIPGAAAATVTHARAQEGVTRGRTGCNHATGSNHAARRKRVRARYASRTHGEPNARTAGGSSQLGRRKATERRRRYGPRRVRSHNYARVSR